MTNPNPIQVEGLAELDRALGQVDKTLRKRLRLAETQAAAPVAAISHELAVSEISGMRRERTIDWSQFRIGSNATSVYVAPKERGRRGRRGPAGKRPNLANLLVEKMDRAVERARPGVERAIERAIDDVVTEAGLG